MKKIFTSLVMLVALFAPSYLWAASNNVITYTSSDGSVVVPNDITVFGANYLSNVCSGGVGTITFDAPVTEVGARAFEACTNLESITLPMSLQSIGMNAFQYCDGLTSIVIPDNVSKIGMGAFVDCALLKDVVLPEKLMVIERGTFQGCESLQSIVIPVGVTDIKRNAFAGCKGLTFIKCLGSIPAVLENKTNVFDKNDVGTIPVYVPCVNPKNGSGYVDAYNATDWAKYFNNIQEPLAIYNATLMVNDPTMGTATLGAKHTECGTEIVAASKTHYEFLMWSDSNKVAKRTVVLDSDTTLMAIFKPTQYSITVVSADPAHGSATGGGLVDYKDSAVIVAASNFGYRFQAWNDGDVNNPRKVEVLGDATYVASFVPALVNETKLESLCDNVTFVDPITGVSHVIDSSDPSSLTWNDSVVGTVSGKDTVYTFVVTPLVAPKHLTQVDLGGIANAVPVLKHGYEPDTAASVASIWNYYLTNDDATLANVTSVAWSYTGVVSCGAPSFWMILTVKDECGNELKTPCNFPVATTVTSDTLVAESCGAYMWAITGKTYNTTGVYVDTVVSAVLCDSVYHVLDLTVWGTDTIMVYDTICPGTVSLNGVLLYEDTMLTMVGKNAHGCPEVTIKYWHVRDTIPVTVVNEAICEGDTLPWLGKEYWYSVEVTDTLVSQYGCDSVVRLNLTVWPKAPITVKKDTVCEGQNYVWDVNLQSYSVSTLDTVVLSDIHGCDSMVVLDLTVTPYIPLTEVYATTCFGVPYLWDVTGKEYTAPCEVDTTLLTANGCDSVVKLYLTELPAIPTTDIDTTICAGKSYYFPANGLTYTASIDTAVVLTSVVTGCDSLVNLHLIVLPDNPVVVTDTTICFGETFLWAADGVVYTETTLNKEYWLKDVHGCDSLVVLNLTVLPEVKPTVIDTVTCNGVAFYWNVTGKYYTGTQNVDAILHNIHGCDSLVSLHLVELPALAPVVVNATTCFGVPYLWDVTGKSYYGTQTIDTILKTANGCDSLMTLKLVELPAIPVTEIDTTICFGEVYFFEACGKVYTSSIDTIATLKGAAGCDSVVHLNLTVLAPIPATVVDTTICAGESFLWDADGVTYTTTTRNKKVTLTNVAGCDSVVVLNLTVLPAVNPTVIDAVTCNGVSYFWDVTGKSYTGTQVVDAMLTDIHGCDSLVSLNLVELPVIDTTVINVTTCYGVPYVWALDGVSYYGTQTVDTVLYSVNGCDSVIVLNLVELPEILPMVTNDTICSGEPFAWRGKAYSAAGTYSDTVTTSTGCDSIYTLNLHVLPAVTPLNEYVTICAGDTYLFNGVSYTSSTTTTATLKNVNGCDSIVTLYLTVLPENSDSVILTEFLCYNTPSYVWDVTGEIYTRDTLVSAVIPDVNGCDSVVFLNLVSLPLITDTVVETICYGESYDWFGTLYNATGIYDHTLASVMTGCDSIVVLDLTVLPEILPVVTNDTICSGEPFAWRGKAYSASGTYSDTVTTSTGCDSIYTLNLHVLPLIPDTVVNAITCYGESYIIGDSIVTTPVANKKIVLPSTSGCDSVVYLNLTILDKIDTTYQTAYLCYGVSEYHWSTSAGVRIYNSATTDTVTLMSSNGCDSVVVFNLIEVPSLVTEITESICHGDTLIWNGEKLYETNTYNAHLTSALTGCDSTVILHLTVLPEIEEIIEDTICAGDTYNWNGVAYAATGVYTENFISVSGCDSMAILKLYVQPVIELVTTETICTGESYLWEGVSYTETTNISKTYTSILTGCDSVMTLNLTVLPPVVETILDEAICAGVTYYWEGNSYITDTIVSVVKTDVHGCDSVVTLKLTVWPVQLDTVVYDTICHGDVYEWEGMTFTDSITYMMSLSDVHGCDSIVTLKLAVLPPVPAEEETFVVCDSLVWNGKLYNLSGDYVDTIPSTTGCDSIVTLHLTVNYSVVTDTFVVACDSYNWDKNGITYTTSGLYHDTLSTIHGCDSILVLHLTINNSTTSAPQDTVICYGDTVIWNGMICDTTGLYTTTLTNAVGCDSTAYLQLTVLPEMVIDSVLISTCVSALPYIWYGDTLTMAGVYTYREQFVQSAICDSIEHVLIFNVLPVATSDTTIMACDSIEWNGSVYMITGDYTYTTTGANGCDSIATLHLVVNNTQYVNDTLVVCDSIEWNGTVYTASGDYVYTQTSSNGCDSVAMLHLTVNNTQYAIDTIVACDSAEWNGTIYTTSGDYVYTKTGSNGCDSVAMLHLTINYTQYATDTIVVCDSIMWNGTVYTISGDYTYITTSVNGCDSIITLNLTVNYSTVGSESIIICNGETYEWNGVMYGATGDYVDTLLNAVGCDSIVTLHLTVLPPMVTEIEDIYVCPSELPYLWYDQYLTASGTYTYREQFVDNSACDSVEHMVMFTVYDISIPSTVTTPIAICGNPVDVDTATYELESYVTTTPNYAPNATIVWQVKNSGVWERLTSAVVTGDMVDITLRYVIISDCDTIESREIYVPVEMPNPDNDVEMDGMAAVSRYNNRVFLFNINEFIAKFGWTPQPEQVTWYKVVGNVDVYGLAGDDIVVGTGHSYNLPDGSNMVGSYYALVEQTQVDENGCTGVYRTIILNAAVGSQAPRLVPNVVQPDEPIALKNLNPSQINEIRIYNATGELIATYTADKVRDFIFKANHMQGYYLVDVTNENEKFTLRYMVK